MVLVAIAAVVGAVMAFALAGFAIEVVEVGAVVVVVVVVVAALADRQIMLNGIEINKLSLDIDFNVGFAISFILALFI